MKAKRLLAGVVGLVFGWLVGTGFVALFTSTLNSANAYNDFLREAPGGFEKIMAVCILVSAAIFLLVPEGWLFRIGFSLVALFIILVITIIVLIISTFGIVNSLATFWLIAAIFAGGSGVIVVIIS